MGDVERLHKIKYMIQARQCVPLDDFLSELEISKATFKRDLEYLRSRMYTLSECDPCCPTRDILCGFSLHEPRDQMCRI